MRRWQNQFEYITHIDNLRNILTRGILSHNKVDQYSLNPKRISDTDIVKNRKDKKTPDGKSLWEYANVYFRAKNAMLFRMVSELGAKNLVILAIHSSILKIPNSFITTGNAASSTTKILLTEEIRKVLSYVQPQLGWDWWKSADDSKRKTMAECLVPDQIPTDYIKGIYVVDYDTKESIKKDHGGLIKDIDVIPDPDMFFQSSKREEINENLFLVEGDMFFSNMQTLTISVNTMGVMGKGLASRAKYQFPDLYIFYQDICKNNKLKMGQPQLYKRDELISETLGLGPVGEDIPTWFLLFPTKTHFKYRSDLDGIEKGLIWLKENYKNLGITSLALPALGCGLGWLSWKEVGPVMIKHLKDFDIPVWIYLPRERKIKEEYLSKEFLIK